MPSSSILELRDGVFDFLVETIEPAEPDQVDRGYAVRDNLIELDGKRIRVFPEGYGGAERLARRRASYEFGIVVVCSELYSDPAQPVGDPVPLEWVDERVDWVEANLFNPLDESFVRDNSTEGLLLDKYRTQTCEVTVVYDPARLDAEKLFWSMIRVGYRLTLSR